MLAHFIESRIIIIQVLKVSLVSVSWSSSFSGWLSTEFHMEEYSRGIVGDQERLLVESGYWSLHQYLGGQLAPFAEWLQVMDSKTNPIWFITSVATNSSELRWLEYAAYKWYFFTFWGNPNITDTSSFIRADGPADLGSP
jgi:hypothetical protein